MLLINNVEYIPSHFPDGTLCMLNMPFLGITSTVNITWKYDNDAELVALEYIVAHIRENYPTIKNIFLNLPYIPNARMDRIDPACQNEQVFTLKYFAQIINRLNFAKVFVLDPHSSVSMGLIDRVTELPVAEFVKNAIQEIKKVNDGDIVIYTPDAGAYKRYSSLLKSLNIPFIYGEKIRNFANGKIEGLRVITNELDIKGKTVLMIDDIIAHGGTFYYSALELQKLGVGKIFAYATHTENSIFDTEQKDGNTELKSKFLKMIYQGDVETLFTTDTIFRGTSDSHIKVFCLNW